MQPAWLVEERPQPVKDLHAAAALIDSGFSRAREGVGRAHRLELHFIEAIHKRHEVKPAELRVPLKN